MFVITVLVYLLLAFSFMRLSYSSIGRGGRLGGDLGGGKSGHDIMPPSIREIPKGRMLFNLEYRWSLELQSLSQGVTIAFLRASDLVVQNSARPKEQLTGGRSIFQTFNLRAQFKHHQRPNTGTGPAKTMYDYDQSYERSNITVAITLKPNTSYCTMAPFTSFLLDYT